MPVACTFSGHNSNKKTFLLLSQHLSFGVPTENIFFEVNLCFLPLFFLLHVVAFGMAQINLSTIWHSLEIYFFFKNVPLFESLLVVPRGQDSKFGNESIIRWHDRHVNRPETKIDSIIALQFWRFLLTQWSSVNLSPWIYIDQSSEINSSLVR